MEEITIKEQDGAIHVGYAEAGYKITHDGVTGDWIVTSDDDGVVQGDWMMSKDDAMLYVLERIGVIENANYQHAPNRTH